MHKNRVEVTVHEDIVCSPLRPFPRHSNFPWPLVCMSIWLTAPYSIHQEVRAIMDTKIPTAAVFDIWTIDEIAEIEAKAEELRTQMKRTGTNQQSGPNRIIAPPRGHERSGYTTATPMGPRVDPTPYLTTHNRQNVRILGNIPTHSRAISGQESNATTSSTPTSVSSSQSVSNSATSPGGSIFNVNWVRSGCMGVPTDIIKPEFLRAHCGKSISGEFNTLSDIFTARIGPVHNGGKPRIYMRRATTGAWNPTTGNKDFGTWPTAATLAPGASIL